MAIYNGATCLGEQLQSLQDQTHRRWHLLASDDGSRDNSFGLIQDFAAQTQRIADESGADIKVTSLKGPGQGAAENFMFLLRQLPEHAAEYGWIAFSDQDDVWLPDRLSRGIAALQTIDDTRPALYCSRSWITNATLSERRLSAPRPRSAGFRNALVQNIVSGNTILLNPAAARLVAQAAVHVPQVVVHDWWVYQLVTGMDGVVVHDDEPTLLYRQHDVNQIGANDTLRARLKRIGQLLRGDFRDWNAINVAALRCSAHDFPPEHRALLDDFAQLPGLRFDQRLRRLARLRLYRQSVSSTMALWLAAVLNKL